MDEQRLKEIQGLSKDEAAAQLLTEVQNVTAAGLQDVKSTRDIPGASDGFEVNIPNDGVIDVNDLGGDDTIDDIQARLDKTGQRVQELQMASQEELNLSNRIAKEDLSTQEAQRDLYGQGFGTPLALLQGEERKIGAERQFNRAFDMLELDLLESSRTRELQVAQGELTQAQAEAEQIQETVKTNDTIIENMAQLFQGTTLQELSQGSPETYQKLVTAAANSNYSLGEIEQALKVEEKAPRTQITEVNGRKVLVNMDTGETISNLGSARSSVGTSSGTGTSSTTSSLDSFLNNVPGLSNDKGTRYYNQLISRGISPETALAISRDSPETIEDFAVRMGTVNNLASMDETKLKDVISKGYTKGVDSNGNTVVVAFTPDTIQQAASIPVASKTEEKVEEKDDRGLLQRLLFKGVDWAERLQNN